ncbi:hypothetical protein [Aggregatibacter actinomycetemcomitans]|uniref:hypothetical protein n=1 Tax=Aggregatibacter actinomycetemcomitans TaxID=714 RepID=UPI001E3346EE|nr:hypothetical protein [Aggregatibacter actinomycetemcomitans]
MNIFIIALVLGLTTYLPEKPTALYVRFAYAVIGILLSRHWYADVCIRYRSGGAIHAVIYQPRAIL